MISLALIVKLFVFRVKLYPINQSINQIVRICLYFQVQDFRSTSYVHQRAFPKTSQAKRKFWPWQFRQRDQAWGVSASRSSCSTSSTSLGGGGA